MKKGEQTVEILGVAKLGNLQISPVANRRLPIFATCEHCSLPHLCLLTAFFLPTILVVLYKFALMYFWSFNTLL